jgi:S-adenosylmethionine hydrolase
VTVISLLSDFGTADGYVAEMKGTILNAAPDVALVDISHDIPPHDIETARLAVARYWHRFPAGSIHVVVVDPGVGTGRAAIAVRSEGRFLVGPDNGVLSPALLRPSAQCMTLPVPADAAPTFHGRDVFAPAAAALARGVAFESLGAPHHEPVIRRTPEPVREPDGWLRGEVITVDRFGNAVTNLMCRQAGEVRIGDRVVPVGRTYADARSGDPIALVGSSGLLEVAVRDGSAADVLALRRGSVVRCRAG